MAASHNILEQQAHNRRLTVLLLVAFILVFGLFGLWFGPFSVRIPIPWRPGARGLRIPVATILAVCIAWWSYRSGDRAILASTRARPAMTSATAEKQFRDVVAEMAIAAGLPIPQAYVIPDPDPNSFATGRDPAHASIAVTEGLLRLVNREELQGVVGHEMAHIQNYDIRLMTVIGVLVGALALLADWVARVRSFTRNWGEAFGWLWLIYILLLPLWLLASVLAPLVSRMLAMAVSRRREYLADASGAQLTRNPMALAAALQKIDAYSGPTEAIGRGIAHLCIDDPLDRKVTNREGFWADLFATHPPIQRRIAALQQMAYLYATKPPSASQT